jgi:hypothetical protein
MEYYYIICDHWDLLQPYFTIYRSMKELEKDMSFLHTCRNSSAHLNLEILNPERRHSLRQSCDRLLKSIQAGVDGRSLAPSNIRASIPTSSTVVDTEKNQWLNKQTNLIQPRRTTQKTVRGLIEGTMLKVTVPAENIVEAGLSDVELASRSVIPVIIIKWDDVNETYIGNLVFKTGSN